MHANGHANGHANNGQECSLTLLEGAPVVDAGGQMRGRVADVAVGTGQEAGRVLALVVKSARGREYIDIQALRLTEAGGLVMAAGTEPQSANQHENALLLRQDLLDRQIIDVYGRKVVRVNDVDLRWQSVERGTPLQVTQVEVGLRGATRRMLKGLLPAARIAAIANRIPAKVIPWEFVDVIEVDPARRVRLKIEHERLAQMHPADIADILEELAPAERQAVFQTLDEETAAEALEEVEPKLQRTLLASLGSEGAADIVEEMDPDAAADLLADLPEAHSDAILDSMEPEERQEVEELLEFREDSAAGYMTTDFVAVSHEGSVSEAMEALRQFEGDPETVTEIYLIDEHRALKGSVPLLRLMLAQPGSQLKELVEGQAIHCRVDTDEDKVAELFDKYNLRTLPVVNSGDKLVGIVEADDVISFLRGRT
ncbi:MAG: magnesium transporter [Acidobacteriaceae bacterium]|jgi:CBS domain-containing protein/sporulation protein YlmC with PRC-barrel domain|nr:magnesium transporter [Acidobacteriaceae bacterium]